MRARWTATMVASLAASACIFPWDDYDPALGGGDTQGGGGAGVGAQGGEPQGGDAGSPPAGGGGAGDGGAGGNTGGAPTGGGGGGSGGAPPGTGICADPFVVSDTAATPGDNTNAEADLFPSCMPSGEELVYEILPSITGVLVIDLECDNDLGIVVRTICDDAGSELTCVDNGSTGEPETTRALVDQGVPVYVIIDAFEPGDVGPFTMTTSIHPLVCGDSIVDPTEDCDPPNGSDCDPNCDVPPESCDDDVDNDQDGFTDCEDVADCAAGCPLAAECNAAMALMATNNGDTTSGTDDFAGYCVGNVESPEDIYDYTSLASGAFILKLSSAADLGLHARTSCTDPTSQVICIDNKGSGTDEDIALPVAAGTSGVLFVDGYAGDRGPYVLTSSFVAVDESEPNNSAVQADAYTSGLVANTFSQGDDDWFHVDVPQGGTLSAETLGLVSTSCTDYVLDTGIEIYDTDGASLLAEDDDGGDGGCSFASVSGLSAGRYYVVVIGYNAPLAYELDVQVN